MSNEANSSTPAPQSHLSGSIAAFEAAYPELYYHIAKGKVTAGEPLYGAIIIDTFGEEIGDGESNISAEDAFRIAVEDAGLTMPQNEPAADRQIELMKDFWAYYGSPPHIRPMNATLLKKDFLSLIERIEQSQPPQSRGGI